MGEEKSCGQHDCKSGWEQKEEEKEGSCWNYDDGQDGEYQTSHVIKEA